MEESFILPVIYKGAELEFSTRLVISTYVYQFHILVNDVELVFEKDDERNYRVINYTPAVSPNTSAELLEAIITSLQKISE